jgi:hypothetical protein
MPRGEGGMPQKFTKKTQNQKFECRTADVSNPSKECNLSHMCWSEGYWGLPQYLPANS